jgi:sodium transport system ATP-binding protein
MIKAENLNKTFHDKKKGRIKAVDDVSFDVNPGEIYGLLGLNGAGKTTTLRVLAGLLKPDSGTAYINGIDVNNRTEAAKAKLGFITGSTGLYGRLKASEMIQYFGRLYGLTKSEARRRTEDLMEMLGMTEYADVKCDKLSTGTKQKVSIARTIIHDPEVIILDEPTAGLDVIASRSVVDFINSEKARSKTIIFSTHVMHEAEKLCDRIGVLHKGKIVADGTPIELNAKAGCADLDDTFVKLVGDMVA